MKKIIISYLAGKALIEYLKDRGYEIEFVKPSEAVYEQISSHPDIFMCKLGISPSSPVIKAEAGEVGNKYPADIAFNAACTGKFFIHNLKHTNKRLLDIVKGLDLTEINVHQGYTKCNTVIVDKRSVITSDSGIYAVLSGINDIDVLKICEGYVKLDGFTHGFLGGASGRVGDELIFNGNLSVHPDFERIKEFVLSKNVKLRYFKHYPLTDIGSFFEIGEKAATSDFVRKY